MVTRFEIQCIDGQWKPVAGTANQRDAETGCRVYACSERGRPFEAYGQLAANSNLAELSLMAHPRKVRVAE